MFINSNIFYFFKVLYGTFSNLSNLNNCQSCEQYYQQTSNANQQYLEQQSCFFFIVWFGPFIVHTISMATGQHDGPLLFLPLTKLKLSKYQWLFWNWQKYIYLRNQDSLKNFVLKYLRFLYFFLEQTNMEQLMPLCKHLYFYFQTLCKFVQFFQHTLLWLKSFLLKLGRFKLALKSMYPSKFLYIVFFDYHCQKFARQFAFCFFFFGFEIFIKAVWRRANCGFELICYVLTVFFITVNSLYTSIA